MKSPFMILIICATFRLEAGTGSPEALGAHRAVVSDQAEVELLVDLLRMVAAGERDEATVRNLIAPGISLSAIRTHTAPTDAYVSIKGSTATVTFGDEAEVNLVRGESGWVVSRLTGVLPGPSALDEAPAGVSVGQTFKVAPVSPEHGIERLSRGVTESMIDRALLSAGGKTASYYRIRYQKSAPFVSSTYIQFMADREWNRILYGNMNHWIRAYTNVVGPVSIAADAGGRLFVAEAGNQRISVLGITGEGNRAELFPHYAFGMNGEPADIALNDNGTPLDTSDDYLFVADAANNVVEKYTVGTHSASLVSTYTGFDNPASLLSGTWNGANNNLLYVIDQTGRRIRLFEETGARLILLAELKGSQKEYYQSIGADHFGNIYLVENISGSVRKYTADLQYLDEDRADVSLESPGYVDVPFGVVDIEGEGIYRAGFDQLFAVERWGEETGVQRRTLGLAMRDIRFVPDADISAITAGFVMTDFGSVNMLVRDMAGDLIRTVHSGWMTSGRKGVLWNRRDDDGVFVPPGTYRFEIEGISPYREESVRSQMEFYLPLYYWQNCGHSIDDAMLVQGSAVSWGPTPSQTVNEHGTSVEYRFTGLSPEGEYMVRAEYASGDGEIRSQDLTVDGITLHGPLSVGRDPVNTGYLSVPAHAFADGEISIKVNKRGTGTAIISQLWLKETGVAFDPRAIDGSVPTGFSLEQNYPNPFNPATLIRFSVPDNGPVLLKVFDITGQEVATLIDEERAAGTYEVRFDVTKPGSGQSFASGVYFYRVQAGRFSEAKKMLLLK